MHEKVWHMPRALIDVTFNKNEFNSTQNFLRDILEMLYIAQDNIKTSQERAHFYANHSGYPHVFIPAQKVQNL
jgi:hypothetical protein